MVIDLYINISKTAVELAVLALIAGSAVYVVKDLMDETITDAEVNPIEG